MLLAKPLKVFRLAGRSILTCQVNEGNPLQQIGSDLSLMTGEGEERRIRIEGVSTATKPNSDIYDLHVSGDEIDERDIDTTSLISSGRGVKRRLPRAHARSES